MYIYCFKKYLQMIYIFYKIRHLIHLEDLKNKIYVYNFPFDKKKKKPVNRVHGQF